ncbi:hypothetical protein [Paenibacillus sp. FSL L8-0463]|uniref:hypothetical protein n=1 Tax=Paenibacillus sp. FSL L8-0463 TaxID=2954687 RepID=UPI00311A1D61
MIGQTIGKNLIPFQAVPSFAPQGALGGMIGRTIGENLIPFQAVPLFAPQGALGGMIGRTIGENLIPFQAFSPVNISETLNNSSMMVH